MPVKYPKEYYSAWRKKHKERLKLKFAIYRKNHKEKIRELHKRYYYRHKEKIKVKAKERYRNNIDVFKARNRMKYIANKDRYIIRSRLYRRTLEGRYSRLRNSAKLRSHEMSISFEDFVSLAIKPCYYCGVSLTGMAAGGLDRLDNSMGYKISNVVPCCASCNVIRGKNLTSEEMKIAMAAIKEFRIKKLLGDSDKNVAIPNTNN